MGTQDNESLLARLGGRAVVGQIRQQLDELAAARDQLELLLQVVTDISSELDLQATLRRIVGAAIRLTGARYGAVGVRADDGTLAAFLHEGMPSETAALMGHLPAGKGLLGLLFKRTEPLRVEDLTAHPAAVGFPEHHPPMRAFLGVPITIRANVYGSLYVTDDRPGFRFTEADEIATLALASAAAVAIENATLFEGVQNAARWTAASREITTVLLAGAPRRPPLQLIAERACELTAADQVLVLVPDDPDQLLAEVDTLTVAAAVGQHTGALIGQKVPVQGSTSGEVFRTAAAVTTDTFRYPIADFTDQGQRPAIVAPLRASDSVVGVIAVARRADQSPFDTEQLALVDDFAHHAALALSLAKSSEQSQQLTVLADRERIARDLHDHVIQRLFLAGMELQGTIARARSPVIVERLTRTVDDLQSTIDEIRTTIFALQPPGAGAMNFRQRIQTVVAELTDDSPLTTTVHFSGAVIGIEASLAEHAEAIVIEAISNSIRHSGATHLTVEIAAGDQLDITITDNGCGIPESNQRHSGLANLQQRAHQCAGTCQITSPPQRWYPSAVERSLTALDAHW